MFEFVFEKNSTPRRLKLRVVDIFWQASSLKSLQKTLGYNEIVPIFYFLKIIFFYKGLQRKKWSRQNTAQSDTAQCFPARSRLCTLCTVLSNFGFPQIFRKISMFLVDIHLKKKFDSAQCKPAWRTQFNLFTRRPVGFDSWKKNAKNLVTLPL